MAVDMFLKLGDIKGESRDSKHKESIDVLSWSWGMSQTGTTHLGTGGGSGKVSVHDVAITKFVDSASPNLMLACCTGKHYDKALLTVRKAGDKPVEYLKLTLKEVLVSSYQTGGIGSDDRMTENVSLNFAEFKAEYTPQDKTGAGGAAIEAGYKIAENVKA